ncbi:Octaprenyl-diphosphate synthase [Catenovulum agarivorans DS-2]|uniref:Octaprenyl-diphosphate synthase n=1 Tax=Catenovulum agarivorans DS-2 TaxID=1328313 RepID=W7QQU6_9ALTE|nr:farnesyl diphosphate synthase [Catenovulum agarivorans]EWH11367.1 Octaprenyl-diphosphate synthase [Catenovulum agarivorans DS-2]
MSIVTELRNFQDWFNQQIDSAFAQIDDQVANELHQAMRYSVSNGGKRIRPFLMYTVGRMLNIEDKTMLPAALALECIHSYSLVHDDLPAMDDDELRRGKPTCHIQFNEATAILAGDSLQTLAFELIANANVSAEIKVAWMKELSKHSGYLGMCGGQALDLAGENRQLTVSELENIHLLKTAALLKAAVNMATACSPNIDETSKTKLDEFAGLIGLAFQIQDDILDVTSTTEMLGKPQGSDEKLNKSTYPGILGLESAIEKANQVFQNALEQLDNLPYNTQALFEFAQFIVQRKH